MIISSTRVALVSALFFLLSACATVPEHIQRGYDFSAVSVVSVADFAPAGTESNSGTVVADAFARQLLGRGITVRRGADAGADAVLTGSVTEYQPNRRYLIRTPQTPAPGGTQVVVYSQPVELGGAGTYNLGTVFGLGDDSKVLVSNATVGISARLTDVRTGDVVWSAGYTYEGLDMTAALDGAVGYLARTIPWDMKAK